MIPHETLQATVEAYQANGQNQTATAAALGIARQTLQNRLRHAAEQGMLGTKPVLPGFRISQISSTPHGDFIQQKPERGPEFVVPEGHRVSGVSALVDGEGRIIQQWQKTEAARDAQIAALRAMADALKAELPRIEPTVPPRHTSADLLNQYIVTDSHFGMLAWREETGADYDLAIAERLLLDWFAAAIDISPAAHTGVLAQLGDLMHHDAMQSVTPAHGHVLDADSRLQKVIRVVIRTIRRVIDLMLRKHAHVHIVMASGNHDPASSAWLREMLAAMYEAEPRVSVDSSPSLYYAYEWGKTALFYHHGDKRGVAQVDATLAGKFRELYGRSTYAYAHIGHLHSDEGRKSGLMYVERHETLAAPDAYAAGGGWLSGRSAKVITYSKSAGEVFRSTLRPEVVAGWPAPANDNQPATERRAA